MAVSGLESSHPIHSDDDGDALLPMLGLLWGAVAQHPEAAPPAAHTHPGILLPLLALPGPQMVRYWWAMYGPSEFGAIMCGLALFDYLPDCRMWLFELLAQMHCRVRRREALWRRVVAHGCREGAREGCGMKSIETVRLAAPLLPAAWGAA